MEFLEGEKCARCSAIPWVKWYVSIDEKLEFTETPGQLQSASCPICRVIGRGIVKYDKPISCLERWIFPPERDEGFTVSNSRADFMLYDKDDQEFIKACKVHPKRVDFTHAKQWIRNCVSSHVECKSPPDSALHDLKVLDCHDRIVVSAPEHCEYVALSYVWGKAGLDNAPDFPRIPDILPSTVEDSIIATKMLGYRYLWIDRYCIDQNDAVSRQHQINQMGTIYSSSQVTIIAAAGLEELDADATYGLPGITKDFKTPSYCAVSDRLRFVHTRRTIWRCIQFSSWYSRGWTFQEGFLSRRRMYFTDVGVEYICDKDRGSEAAKNLAATLRDPSLEPGLAYMERMMHQYTGRRLTYDHDALNAIVGALETQTEDDHMWGVHLVKDDIATYVFLNWRHRYPLPRREQFPSWSPLGWCGQADYYSEHPCISDECSLEVWCEDEYKPFAHLTGKLSQQHHLPGTESSRFLKVTTKIIPIEFMRMKGIVSDNSDYRSGLYAKVPYSESLDLYVFAFWDTKDRPVIRRKQGSIKLPCAVIIRRAERHYRLRHPTPFEEEIQILILRQHDTHYERIGYFAWDSFLLDTYSSDKEPWDSDQSSDGSSSFDSYYQPEETTFALDKQGNQVAFHLSEDNSRQYGDGRYWSKDGIDTTFLLG